MNAPVTHSATDRFAMALDGLCRAVAARLSARTMTPGFIVLIWQRLRRVEVRFQALVAAIRSGTLPAERIRARATAARRSASGASAFRWPRRFGWLLPLVPSEAACYAGQLRGVLEDAEMVALIAASPRLGRTLRPLCRMLGLEVALVSPPADAAADSCDRHLLPDGPSARPVPVRVSRPSTGALPAAQTFATAQDARPLVPT